MAKFRLGPKPEPPIKAPRTKPPKPSATLFEQLLPCTWRGIHFPVSAMKVSFSQDVVEHKYWGVDGADIEATGRSPMQIEAEIPFVNGIVPGKGEKWGVLYPTTFRAFLKAFADRSRGDLQHPELDIIIARPVSIDFAHSAQQRDGVVVSAKWVETIENVESIFETASPIEVADLAALDLDSSQADILALAPEAAFPVETFDTLLNKASGFVDSITTTATLLANKPAQLRARVQRLEDSVDRARNVLTWPVKDACEKLRAASYAVEDAFSPTHEVIGTGPAAPGKAARRVGRYTTPTRMTIGGIVLSLPSVNTIDELMGLNPVLVSQFEVGAGTLIRYYV